MKKYALIISKCRTVNEVIFILRKRKFPIIFYLNRIKIHAYRHYELA